MVSLESISGLLIVLSMALAARNLSGADYSELLTLRRDGAFLVPIMLLGLGTTLVKELSILGISEKKDSILVNSTIMGGISIALSTFLTLITFIIIFNTFFSISSEYDYFLFIWILFFGINAIMFSIFRAQERYITATCFNFLSLGFSPFIAALLSFSFLGFIKLNLFLVALNFLIFSFILLKNLTRPIFLFNLNIVLHLIKSGFHRFLADFGFNFVLWSPIFVGRFILNSEDVLYFGGWSFAMMILTLFVQFIFPLTTIALPEISKKFVGDLATEDKTSLIKINFIIIFLSVLIQLLYYFAGKYFMVLVFGSIFLDYALQVALMISALPAFLVYSFNRAVIDAIYDAPINFYINFIAAFGIIICAVLMDRILEYSYLVEFIFPGIITLMGLASLLAVFRKLSINPNRPKTVS